MPAAPKPFSKELKAEWRALWASQLAATYTESDVPALRRLFELRHRVAEFEAEIFDGDGTALTTGSTGQTTLHPLLRQADTYRAQILALEDRFGLSPQSRLKLGIALGEAHRSLDDMNARIAKRVGGTNTDDRSDPRITAIDTGTA